MKKILKLSLLAVATAMVGGVVTFTATIDKTELPVASKAEDAPPIVEKDIAFNKDSVKLVMTAANNPVRVTLRIEDNYADVTDWAGSYVAAADNVYPKIKGWLHLENYILIDGQNPTFFNNQSWRAIANNKGMEPCYRIDNFSTKTEFTITLKAGLQLPSRAYINNANSGGNTSTNVFTLNSDYTYVFRRKADTTDETFKKAGAQPFEVVSFDSSMSGTKTTIDFTHNGYGTVKSWIGNVDVVTAASYRYAINFYIPEAKNDYKDYKALGYQGDGDSETISGDKNAIKTRIKSYNFWYNHILIDDKPIVIWNNAYNRVWIHGDDSSGFQHPDWNYLRLNYKIENLSTAKTLTILAGTELPSAHYIAQGGTPASYVVRDTVVYYFNAAHTGFDRYCIKPSIDLSKAEVEDTDVTNLYFVKEGSATTYSYMNIVLNNYDKGDFGSQTCVWAAADGYYDPINYSNIFDGEHVLVDGKPLTKDSSGTRSARYRTSYGNKGVGLVLGYNPDNLGISKVTIKAGTLFPSYALGTSQDYSKFATGKFYRARRDVTFTWNANTSKFDRSYSNVDYHSTKVTTIELSENAAGKSFRMNFWLSEFDYTGGIVAYDGYFNENSNVYTHVLTDGTPISTLFGNSTQGYRGHRLENSKKCFSLQLTGTFGQVSYDKIVVKKDTEFVSVSYYKGQADREQVYKTDNEQVFVRTTGNIYKDLADLRTASIKVISEYPDMSKYMSEQVTLINGYISDYTALINKCETYQGLLDLEGEFKAAVDAVKDAAYYKDVAKAQLDAFDKSDYTLRIDDVNAVIADAKTKIDTCKSCAAIETVLQQAYEAIDEIPTDQELLAEFKLLAYATLDAVDTSLYKMYNQAEVNRYLSVARMGIFTAETIDEVREILTSCLEHIANIETDLQVTQRYALGIIDLIDLDEYTVNAALVNELIETAKEGINNATTVEDVLLILNIARDALDLIESDAQILARRKADALAVIDSLDTTGVTINARLLAEAIDTAKDGIRNATTLAELDQAASEATRLITSIKTDEEVLAEELAIEKREALEAVEARAQRIDMNKYSAENKEFIQQQIDGAKAAINAATSAIEIENILNSFRVQLDNVPTQQSKGCSGSIVATSAILTITALCGIGLISLRKRKED